MSTYLGKFKDVKKHLPKIFLKKKEAAKVISHVGYLQRLVAKTFADNAVPEFGYVMNSEPEPGIYIHGTSGSANIKEALVVVKSNAKLKPGLSTDYVHVGYKRADDLLDKSGNLISKSRALFIRLEVIQAGGLLKYPLYLVHKAIFVLKAWAVKTITEARLR